LIVFGKARSTTCFNAQSVVTRSPPSATKERIRSIARSGSSPGQFTLEDLVRVERDARHLLGVDRGHRDRAVREDRLAAVVAARTMDDRVDSRCFASSGRSDSMIFR